MPLGPRRRRTRAPGTPEQPPLPFSAVNWRRLAGYLRPHWRRAALAVVGLLVSSALGLVFPLVIVRLLDSVTQATSERPLNALALLLVGVFLTQAVFSALQSYLLAFVGEHIVFDLRSAVYAQLHRLSLDFYAKRRVGDLVSRLSNDVTQMRTVLTTNLTTMLSQVLTLVGSIAIVIALNARLTLFIVALAPLLIGVAYVFGRRLQKASTRLQDQLAESTTVAEEGLQAIRVVKSFGREDYETSRYHTATERSFRASLRLAVYHSSFTALMTFLGFTSIASIVWFGGREVIAGRLSLALITGFLMYGFGIAASLGGLAGLYGQVRVALGAVQRVFELLDARPTVQDAPGARELPRVRGAVSFDGVSFSYNGTTPVLRDVSLDVREGEILALVGPSGAGKSSILNLIPRLYDPTAGTVRVDGWDLRDVTQRSLRAQIGIVPQETILFGGTIRENIWYGRLDATEREVIDAARTANAHDFIMAFPQGYDTVVGERGMNLSGGERQRIAIARAILKDPRILLLDEATSSLDNESEHLVQEALQTLMRDRTTVLIAHRLSTTKVADRIAVLNDGRVVELGTHDALLALDGLYARLYAMQFRAEQEAPPLRAAPPLGANGHDHALEREAPEGTLLGALLDGR